MKRKLHVDRLGWKERKEGEHVHGEIGKELGR